MRCTTDSGGISASERSTLNSPLVMFVAISYFLWYTLLNVRWKDNEQVSKLEMERSWSMASREKGTGRDWGEDEDMRQKEKHLRHFPSSHREQQYNRDKVCAVPHQCLTSIFKITDQNNQDEDYRKRDSSPLRSRFLPCQ